MHVFIEDVMQGLYYESDQTQTMSFLKSDTVLC